MQEGVGIIVTNETRDKFYVQQKDEEYWIKEYRLKHCFFGGGIELNEKKLNALERELNEELTNGVAEVIYKNSKEIFNTSFVNTLGQSCKYFLYESILTEKRLRDISKRPVMEGKCGILIKRENLNEYNFFNETWKLLEQYIYNNSKDMKDSFCNSLVSNFDFQKRTI